MKKQESSKKVFYGAWVAFGMLQLALLSGCGKAGAADTSEALLSSQSPNDTTQVAGRAPGSLPVRVSRSFFDSSTNGSIQAGSQAAETAAVSWSQIPAEGGDQVGCAQFGSTGVELCFELMNDVDSFGVNGREMKASGLADYVNSQLGAPCPGVDWDISLASAERQPAAVSSRQVTQFTARFTAQAPAGSGCTAAPVSIELNLQK